MLAGRPVPPPQPFGTRHDFSIYGLDLRARRGRRRRGARRNGRERCLHRNRKRRECPRVRDPLGRDRVHDHDEGVATTAVHSGEGAFRAAYEDPHDIHPGRDRLGVRAAAAERREQRDPVAAQRIAYAAAFATLSVAVEAPLTAFPTGVPPPTATPTP